ncbi:hypothetical protein [Mameliella alba]|uniref:hypothetical protein n=1 Tax=Mameliella alba TaxID=561184 RepID=UPI0014310AAD|nr:hypothetical protein [Mameliella alba]
MIQLSKKEQARLYLAAHRALEVPDQPTTKEDAQRAALAEVVSGCVHEDSPVALHTVFRLAEALDHFLVYDTDTAGPYSTTLPNVTKVAGGDKSTARCALRLLGWRQTERGDWCSDPAAPRRTVESVKFPRDLLATFLRLELDEVQEKLAA